MKHVYILDYNSGNIFHGKFDETNETIYSYIDRIGFKEDECEYMTTDVEQEIIEIEK